MRERERERGETAHTHECTRQAAAERGRERIPSRLLTVSMEPNVGHDLMNCEIMT